MYRLLIIKHALVCTGKESETNILYYQERWDRQTGISDPTDVPCQYCIFNGTRALDYHFCLL